MLVGQVVLEPARDRAVRLEEARPGREPVSLEDGYDETSVARGFGSGVRIFSICSRILTSADGTTWTERRVGSGGKLQPPVDARYVRVEVTSSGSAQPTLEELVVS